MTSPSRPSPTFAETRWSLVRRAVDTHDPASKAALETLCTHYWQPIYAFIRRSGKSAHDAEDLTQGFFARVIEKNLLAAADPDKGRLRSFLLTCLKRHLMSDFESARAQKRGGGRVVDFSSLSAEELYLREPVDNWTPDRLFQRQWALQLLARSMGVLSGEYAAAGKGAAFEQLSVYLGLGPGQGREVSYEESAERLGVTLANVKIMIKRLRDRWREILMNEVAATLEDPTPENIKAELMELTGYF